MQRKLCESGHLLLAILLMMALMVIAATYEAPRIVQQMKRDREEEMIHRGTEYARAIKKFYKKFGRYPSSLEQLENTNNIRFLRKRYKDPLTKDGKWTLLRYGDIAGLLNAGAPGTSAAALASRGQQTTGTPAGQQGTSGFGSSSFGSSSSGSTSSPSSGGFGTSSFGSGNAQPVTGPQGGLFPQPQGQAGAGQTTAGSTFGSAAQNPSSGFGSSATASSGFGASSNPSANNPTNNPTSTSPFSSASGEQFGGGAIVGVASKSKDPTIRIYNKKKIYDEWQFIYNPMMDQPNVLLRGPYSPTTIGNTNIGTPAGQMNQSNQQQSPFGQQSGFGQQSTFGQQPGGSSNQQPITPGQQFPPDQNQ